MIVKEVKATEFEKFIIKCCEMAEWDLRIWLKETLTKNGFRIIEDNYVSDRPGKYKDIPNMLAIRGNAPKVCLAAHTDCTRDHFYGWRNNTNIDKPTPVLIEKKSLYSNEKPIRIITDKNQKTPVGGDDRLGVAINVWIALNCGYDMGLYFATDEEIGCGSSSECFIDELSDFAFVAQVDRGNIKKQLITKISGTRLCSDKMTQRLLRIARNMGPQYEREVAVGLMTDVQALTQNGVISESCNMSCGYLMNHSPNEVILTKFAEETMHYVAEIIKDFEMETIDELEGNEKQEADNDIDYDNEEIFETKAIFQVNYSN